MDEQTKKEINRLYNDVKSSKDNLEIAKNSFAETLNNGLGDEMIKYLDNPKPISKKKKNLWRKISELF